MLGEGDSIPAPHTSPPSQAVVLLLPRRGGHRHILASRAQFEIRRLRPENGEVLP